MKPCEFDGWVEVEHHDPIQEGDVWFNINTKVLDPTATVWIGQVGTTLGKILNAPHNKDIAKQYRMFRKGSLGPRRLPLNPHFSEPLPLP